MRAFGVGGAPRQGKSTLFGRGLAPNADLELADAAQHQPAGREGDRERHRRADALPPSPRPDRAVDVESSPSLPSIALPIAAPTSC